MVPQFFLITPPVDDAPAFRATLDPLLSTGAVAVMLVRFAAPDEGALKRLAGALRAPIQDAGAALLIDCPEDARLVARAGLDGVHVEAPGPRLREAIGTLKPGRIVGVGGLRSRHDAMEAGEADIDYVMFGEPRADGSVPPFSQTLERAQWWVPIFNVPCVAYAPDLASLAPLAAAGVDFLALGPWLFRTPAPAATLAEARRIAKAAAAPD